MVKVYFAIAVDSIFLAGFPGDFYYRFCNDVVDSSLHTPG